VRSREGSLEQRKQKTDGERYDRKTRGPEGQKEKDTGENSRESHRRWTQSLFGKRDGFEEKRESSGSCTQNGGGEKKKKKKKWKIGLKKGKKLPNGKVGATIR